jgi:hypothetical protein
MNYKFSNNIRVFFDWKESGSPRSVVIEKPKNPEQNKQIEQSNKVELENLSKKALGWLLLSQNKWEALVLLRESKKDIQKIDSKLQKDYTKLLAIIEQWIVWKSLFTDNGEPKKIDDTIKKQIASSLGIDYTANIEVQEKVRVADAFRKKNPIEKYKNELVDFCINHPKLAEYGSRINEEREKIQKNWGAYLPEYSAIIETLAKITTSEAFDKMTGGFSKTLLQVEWKWKDSKKYEENLRLFLNDVVSQKKPLDINTLNLSKEYISVKDKADIKYNIDRMRVDLENYKWKEDKLARINQYIATIDANQSKLSPEVLKKIKELYNSEKVRIISDHDEGLIWLSKNFLKGFDWRQDTKENFEKENKNREKMETSTGRAHFVYFDKELKKYKTVSWDDISKMMSQDISKLNKWLFQSILEIKNWDKFFESILTQDAMSAIGLYAEKKSDTKLFLDAPRAKAFFIEKYKTSIKLQETIFENKKLNENDGKFEDIFPELHKKFPDLSDDIRSTVKEWKLETTYKLLIDWGKVSGEIANIMNLIRIDSNNLIVKTKAEALKASKEFEWKALKEFKTEFNLNTQKDIDTFKKIEDKKIQNGELSQDERLFLLVRINNRSTKNPLFQLLNGIRLISHHATIQWKAAVIGKMIEKNDPAKKPELPTTDQENIINNAWALNKSLEISKVNTSLWNQNSKIAGIEKFDTIEKIGIELQRLSKLKNPNQEQIESIRILRSRLRDEWETAIATTNFVNSPWLNREDGISIVRSITGTKLTDKEIEKWIDSQKFISTYVTEKNFIEMVEKNAAYMNLGQVKSIGDLYENSWKVDVSRMSSDTGSVRLWETNIWWTNTYNGMNDLMNCKVEVWDGWIFSRTIRSPEWKIVAENIPLENINGTIQQLWRFYSLGLGSIAPYMKDVATSIWKSRPDSITGLDGGFDINEDTKFLKILAIMLYGEDSLPKEMNIPNLVQVFNRTWREYDPKYALMQKGILQDTGGINMIRLDAELQSSSKKVA